MTNVFNKFNNKGFGGDMPSFGSKNTDYFTSEFEINDAPVGARNLLTKGIVQDEINQCSGAAISTRGRFMAKNEHSRNPNDRPLYLFIQGPTKQSIELAIQKIHEIIRTDIGNPIRQAGNFTAMPSGRLSGFSNQPPPLVAKPPPSLTRVEKLFIGLDGLPASLDLRGKIIGQGGSNLHYIRSETGAAVTLRGRGSQFIEPSLGREAPDALHLYIEHPRQEGLDAARQLAVNLVETLVQELQAIAPDITTNPQIVGMPPRIMAGPPLSVPPPQQQFTLQHQQQQTIEQSMHMGNAMQSQMQQIQQIQQQQEPQMILQQPPPMVRPPVVNIPPPGIHIPQHAGPLVPPPQLVQLSAPPPSVSGAGNVLVVGPPPNQPIYLPPELASASSSSLGTFSLLQGNVFYHQAPPVQTQAQIGDGLHIITAPSHQGNEGVNITMSPRTQPPPQMIITQVQLDQNNQIVSQGQDPMTHVFQHQNQPIVSQQHQQKTQYHVIGIQNQINQEHQIGGMQQGQAQIIQQQQNQDVQENYAHFNVSNPSSSAGSMVMTMPYHLSVPGSNTHVTTMSNVQQLQQDNQQHFQQQITVVGQQGQMHQQPNDQDIMKQQPPRPLMQVNLQRPQRFDRVQPLPMQGGQNNQEMMANNQNINQIPIDQIPVNQLPPNQMGQNQMMSNQIPLTQMPPNQIPLNQMPPGQIPINQMPPHQIPLHQMPPNQMPPNQMIPNQMPPNQMPPNQMPPNQLPPNQMPPNQMPPNQIPTNQLPPNHLPPNQMPPNQMLPNQMPPNQMQGGEQMPPPNQMQLNQSQNPNSGQQMQQNNVMSNQQQQMMPNQQEQISNVQQNTGQMAPNQFAPNVNQGVNQQQQNAQDIAKQNNQPQQIPPPNQQFQQTQFNQNPYEQGRNRTNMGPKGRRPPRNVRPNMHPWNKNDQDRPAWMQREDDRDFPYERQNDDYPHGNMGRHRQNSYKALDEEAYERQQGQLDTPNARRDGGMAGNLGKRSFQQQFEQGQGESKQFEDGNNWHRQEQDDADGGRSPDSDRKRRYEPEGSRNKSPNKNSPQSKDTPKIAGKRFEQDKFIIAGAGSQNSAAAAKNFNRSSEQAKTDKSSPSKWSDQPGESQSNTAEQKENKNENEEESKAKENENSSKKSPSSQQKEENTDKKNDRPAESNMAPQGDQSMNPWANQRPEFKGNMPYGNPNQMQGQNFNNASDRPYGQHFQPGYVNSNQMFHGNLPYLLPPPPPPPLTQSQNTMHQQGMQFNMPQGNSHTPPNMAMPSHPHMGQNMMPPNMPTSQMQNMPPNSMMNQNMPFEMPQGMMAGYNGNQNMPPALIGQNSMQQNMNMAPYMAQNMPNNMGQQPHPGQNMIPQGNNMTQHMSGQNIPPLMGQNPFQGNPGQNNMSMGMPNNMMNQNMAMGVQNMGQMGIAPAMVPPPNVMNPGVNVPNMVPPPNMMPPNMAGGNRPHMVHPAGGQQGVPPPPPPPNMQPPYPYWMG